MKSAKKLFAILFLALYAIYASNAVFGGSGVYQAAAAAFPSREGMVYLANEAGFRGLPLRTTLLEAHARLQVLLGKTESGGLDVVATQNGSFVKGNGNTWNSYAIEQFAIRLHRLEAEIEARGLDTKVVYISAHPQANHGQTEPIRDFPLPDQETLMDTMLYYLRAYNVDFLDTQFTLNRTALSPDQYIFKTDTIWTTEASFVTVQAFVDKLNDQYDAGIDLDRHYFNTDNFIRTIYEDAMMGSMGMRAGEPFTGREDFIAITPSYETSFTYTARGTEETTVEGTFEETLFNSKHLEPLEPYTYSAYSSYMDGGAAYQRVIVNHDQEGGARVLFLHDASALPFAAFSALGFNETHLYWPELAPADSDFSLLEYVSNNGIDYVFFLAECDYYAIDRIVRQLDRPVA